MFEELHKQVCDRNQQLPQQGPVTWTSGNASGRDSHSSLVVIQPSGVLFEDLISESIDVVQRHAPQIGEPEELLVDEIAANHERCMNCCGQR